MLFRQRKMRLALPVVQPKKSVFKVLPHIKLYPIFKSSSSNIVLLKREVAFLKIIVIIHPCAGAAFPSTPLRLYYYYYYLYIYIYYFFRKRGVCVRVCAAVCKRASGVKARSSATIGEEEGWGGRKGWRDSRSASPPRRADSGAAAAERGAEPGTAP